jgi:head-tail adaptor
MDRLIRIERSANKTPNDLGEVEYNYTTVGHYYANVLHMAGTESDKNSVKVEANRVKFTIRFADVTADDRIAYANEYYDIESVSHIERNRFTVIEATCRAKLEGIATTGTDIKIVSISPAVGGTLSVVKYDTPIHFNLNDSIVIGGTPTDGYYFGSHLVAWVIDVNTVLINLPYDNESFKDYTVTRVPVGADIISPVVSFASALGGTATVVLLLNQLREDEDIPVGTVVEFITSLEMPIYTGQHTVTVSISPVEFFIDVPFDNKEPGYNFNCKLITWGGDE